MIDFPCGMVRQTITVGQIFDSTNYGGTNDGWTNDSAPLSSLAH